MTCLLTNILIGVGTVGAVVVAGPIALGVIGYGAAGIINGSTAAGMMSAAAIANGGGMAAMAAGGVVATCQSLAMGGIPAAVSVGAGLVATVTN